MIVRSDKELEKLLDLKNEEGGYELGDSVYSPEGELIETTIEKPKVEKELQMLKDKENHDCHASPEDGCTGCL